MTKSLQDRHVSTPLYGGNAPYVEYFYERYLVDPGSVDEAWRAYFQSLGDGQDAETPRGPIEAQIVEQLSRRRPAARATGSAAAADLEKQVAVIRLIAAFRLHGHRLAQIDPLGLAHQGRVADLDPAYHGLGEADMDSEFYTDGLAGSERLPLRKILELLHHIYSRSIGAEFTHISSTRERDWLRQRFETGSIADVIDNDDRLMLLRQLTAAEGIERYLHTRYVGQKRFSLEGGETLIPLTNDIVREGGERGVREVVIGMAHRGRLNVLVNVLGKSPANLFAEFEGEYDSARGSGDVKYHMGFSSDIETPGGNVHLALAFNPSHLEIVNPVVEGSVRARQDRRHDTARNEVLPVLIHGDAAFAGQGVVMETLQLSDTRGYTTGGSIHIIVNNQIGFTTSHPADARSTAYASDVAKMVEAPVLHVNGDDPEAVVFAGRVALEYRMRFNEDVVIDLVCYRRHGHNEADEPAATQPIMYKRIRKHPTVRQKYTAKLVEAGIVEDGLVQTLANEYREALDDGAVAFLNSLGMIGNEYTTDWSPYLSEDWAEPVDTSLSRKRLDQLAARIVEVPQEVKLHSRVKRLMAERWRMAAGEIQMDWGFAETLAYAALLTDGYGVRLSGQDSGRGTFFHRHAVLHDQATGAVHIPLQHVAPEQPEFEVIDSLLSEEAVVGFEYGYATTDPTTLVIWEAQFGDFVNGAQVVIDQFISSGGSKWGRLCALTMFLPHGYEGQGPEHSSARLERFLQLCAEHNMQVCVPSTPAQMFHMIRRQMLRSMRRPLIVMTPKSLLRHKLSTSPLSAITGGRFQTLIGEVDDIAPQNVTRIVFCSGKVYYDLLEARRETGREDVALVRIEQLYPFPIDAYAEKIQEYPRANEIVWCQEEPQNQGAWYQIRHRLQEPLGNRHELIYAGRESAAAPAAGYYKLHLEQQKALVAEALGDAMPATLAVHQ